MATYREIHRDTHILKGFANDVREILKPRILSEGYTLHSHDEGKQVYIRGDLALNPKWFFGGPDWEEFLSSIRLTVAYVLVPDQTTVSFVWESPYEVTVGPKISKWVTDQASAFFSYLDEWIVAAGKDPPSPA